MSLKLKLAVFLQSLCDVLSGDVSDNWLFVRFLWAEQRSVTDECSKSTQHLSDTLQMFRTSSSTLMPP